MSDLAALSQAATQGEWTIGNKDAGTDERYISGPHFEICKCFHHAVQSIEKEMEANAELICKAINGIRKGQLVEAPVWQDIETAPKDRLILVMAKQGAFHTAYFDHYEGGTWWIAGTTLAISPTLWTYLTPPAQEQSE